MDTDKGQVKGRSFEIPLCQDQEKADDIARCNERVKIKNGLSFDRPFLCIEGMYLKNKAEIGRVIRLPPEGSCRRRRLRESA